MAQGLDSYSNRNSENDAMNARRKQDIENWSNMLKMINQVSPETMLGYGIGRLLRGRYDHMMDKKERNTNLDDGAGGGTQTGSTALQSGVLGDGFTQTKHEVVSPDGKKESVTTTSPFSVSGGNGRSFADMVAAQGQALDNAGYTFNPNMLRDSLMKPRNTFGLL